ncbi:MAG: molybdopterin-dependent oxidoreductase [Candidatus Bathyarchaeota archaeon]|nr:molybdopterin-dependent oxidoreductase [Candidatus Bathyarchaeota archaeon]
MKRNELPPGQHEIPSLLRWNIEHPGIVPENPEFDPKKWKLTVDGEVENPLELTWDDLLKLPATESTSDFHCVEGWSVRNLKWRGIKFSTLAQIVKPEMNATNVLFTCSDGYTTSLALEDLLRENVLFAYKLNDKFLETPIGGPLRLIIPDKYAYKSAMWIERVTFSETKELGYWEKRGYSDTADVWKDDRFARRRGP